MRISLTRCSTSASTAAGTAPVAAKSKRNRPGEFSDPAWVAVSPSASRNALCTMCVAVCEREMARRRSTSTRPSAARSSRTSPEVTRARCTISPGTGCWTSETSAWPPPAKYDGAGVGELAATLGVEGGAVEDDLDLVAFDRAAAPTRRTAAGRRRRPSVTTSS